MGNRRITPAHIDSPVLAYGQRHTALYKQAVILYAGNIVIVDQIGSMDKKKIP